MSLTSHTPALCLSSLRPSARRQLFQHNPDLGQNGSCQRAKEPSARLIPELANL